MTKMTKITIQSTLTQCFTFLQSLVELKMGSEMIGGAMWGLMANSKTPDLEPEGNGADYVWLTDDLSHSAARAIERDLSGGRSKAVAPCLQKKQILGRFG